MSKEHDKRLTIKLTLENEKELKKRHRELTVPTSFSVFVNWIIEKAIEATTKQSK